MYILHKFSVFFLSNCAIFTKIQNSCKIEGGLLKKKRGMGMLVCGHGNVDEYCARHGMDIVERYDGDIAEYGGKCDVLVTDRIMSREEYLLLKILLQDRGTDLILVARNKTGGRYKFGYDESGLTDHGRTVVGRILELHDRGWTLRKIMEDKVVRYPDGRRIALSTIHMIVSSREKYEKEGL